MAACKEELEAPTEQQDVARGEENLPISAWPPGAGPEPFQVGAGLGAREAVRSARGRRRGGAQRLSPLAVLKTSSGAAGFRPFFS